MSSLSLKKDWTELKLESTVYDSFEDEYIDVRDIDQNAPPERYLMLTDKLLIENVARWITDAWDALKKEK